MFKVSAIGAAKKSARVLPAARMPGDTGRAMSQENVELSRLITDAFNRRDVEATLALWDDEGVWYPAVEAGTEGRKPYRGHEGLRQYYRGMAEVAEESHFEFPEVYDLGDRVLGVGRLWMKFTSGVELDQEGACLWTWRNQKCIETRTWLSHAEALEAVGLSE
jgi:ketosteroid isomerase-like protein